MCFFILYIGEERDVRHTSLEEMPERCGYGSLKLHALASDRMPEAEHVGVQAQAVQWVVAIAILYVAANGMAHVGGMYAYLVLAASLKFILHKRVFCGTVKHMKMGNGIFSPIIHRR